MIVFQTLMMIYGMLIIVNIILTFILWNSTKSKLLKVFFIHWCLLFCAFYLQTITIHFNVATRILIHLFPNFVVHYSLAWVFTAMLNIKLPLKQFLLLQIPAGIGVILLKTLGAPEQWITVPVVIAHALIHFYATYLAFRYSFKEMNLSLKIIALVLIFYGLHLFTYAYFSVDLDKLAVGFGIALAIHMAIAILFPTAIIELMTRENIQLKSQMEYSAKISHSSRMVALGEMAGGLAHEINNPLMALSLSLELVKKNIINHRYENLGTLIDKSQNTVQRMAKIVKGLLSFSREEKPHFTTISAHELISETLLFCSEKIKTHNIELHLALPKTDVSFTGEKTLLIQVLLNLINNAYDAVMEIEEKWIKINFQDLEDKIKFSITDSGKIISKEIQEKLFEPFFTTKEVDKGTGLGLSISKGIIDSHHGRLLADFTGNTTFYFIIPKQQETDFDGKTEDS